MAHPERSAREFTRDPEGRIVDTLLTGAKEYRALRYIWLLNGQGYLPLTLEAEAYFEKPNRGLPQVRYPALDAIQSMLGGLTSGDVEPVLRYLERLSWVEMVARDDGERVRITPLGTAVCRAMEERRNEADEETALVLDPEDPFAYARFTERLGQMTDVLLVDPYFRLQQLLELHQTHSIRRLLIGARLEPGDRTSISLALAALPRIDEVRLSADIHDRFLIPQAGDVLHLGASVNGIGRKISVLVPLRGSAAAKIRSTHESLWRKAAPLKGQD